MATLKQSRQPSPTDQERVKDRRPRGTVAPSRLLRRTAVHRADRRDGRPVLFGWGGHLSRAEKERIKARLAFVALSGVLSLVVLLVGGTLVWDKVVLGQRPVLKVDGRAVTLQHYANVLSYKLNLLNLEYERALELASQPAPPDADPAQGNIVAQFARQRLAQIDNQRSGLSVQLAEDMIDEFVIRDEAVKRNITATRDEIDAELKRLVGYQDPGATPAPASTPATAEGTGAEPAGTATAAASPAAGATAAPTAAATAARGGGRADSFEARYRDYQRATAGTDAIIRQDIENQILRRKLSEQITSAVAAHAEQVRARHILLPDETAAMAAQERLQRGESFAALAAELSTDSSNKDQGGDLGWFPRGAMVSEFEQAAFQLQPGQTSGPVKTSFGVHLIRVDERDAARELDPQQLQRARSDAFGKWLEKARDEHTIDRFVDADKVAWAARNGRTPAQPNRPRR